MSTASAASRWAVRSVATRTYLRAYLLACLHLLLLTYRLATSFAATRLPMGATSTRWAYVKYRSTLSEQKGITRYCSLDTHVRTYPLTRWAVSAWSRRVSGAVPTSSRTSTLIARRLPPRRPPPTLSAPRKKARAGLSVFGFLFSSSSSTI